MDKTYKIAVYGSLRKGEYNCKRFEANFGEGYTYLKTTSILGYNIYDLGSYPGLKVSEDDTDRVIVDIMACDEACFRSIERMEHGAGYSTIKVKDEHSDETYFAYQFEYPVTPSDKVESGDWSKYLSHEQTIEA